MAVMTVTEGLAEIKTINSRLETKRQHVISFLTHAGNLRDPLETEPGGTKGMVDRELQAIGDLEQRIVNIRRAIARSNDETIIVIDGKGRSVTEWLAWRKDVSTGTKNFLRDMRNHIAQARAAHEVGGRIGRGIAAVQQNTQVGEVKPLETRVYVNEKWLAEESEKIEKVLGDLDGQLSMKNATTKIEVGN